MKTISLTIDGKEITAREGESLLWVALDNGIYIPLTTLQQIGGITRTNTGERVISSIVVAAVDQEYSEQIKNEITALLRERHEIANGVDDDFTITSMDDIIDQLTEVFIFGKEQPALFQGKLNDLVVLGPWGEFRNRYDIISSGPQSSYYAKVTALISQEIHQLSPGLYQDRFFMG